MQTELCVDETYEDSVNNHIVNTNKDKGLAGTKEDSPGFVDGNSEDEMPDAKPDQELTENNDNKSVDANDKKSTESIVEVDGTTGEEVHICNDTSIKENDNQMSDNVHEVTLDKVENFSVDMKNNSKVTLENPNEFIEPEVKRNVVKHLFEGTFLKNSRQIIENFEKFPKHEVNVKEVISQKAKSPNPDKLMEGNSVMDVNLKRNHNRYQEDIGEDDAKANKDHRVVSVGTKKPAKKADKKPDAKKAANKPVARKPAAEPKAKKPAKKAKKPTKKADKMPAAKKATKKPAAKKHVAKKTVNNSAMIREPDSNKQHSMVAKPTGMMVDESRLMNVIKLSFPWNPGDKYYRATGIPLLG